MRNGFKRYSLFSYKLRPGWWRGCCTARRAHHAFSIALGGPVLQGGVVREQGLRQGLAAGTQEVCAFVFGPAAQGVATYEQGAQGALGLSGASSATFEMIQQIV